MELNKYSEIIAQTAIYPREVKNFGVAYAFLGIYDEIWEVSEKEDANDEEGAHKERFDVVWYICALCKELNQSFEDLVVEYFNTRGPSLPWEPPTDTYFGKIKKYYRDNKQIDWNHMKSSFLLPVLDSLFMNYEIERFKEGLEENYNKLISRREKGTIQGDGDNR